MKDLRNSAKASSKSKMKAMLGMNDVSRKADKYATNNSGQTGEKQKVPTRAMGGFVGGEDRVEGFGGARRLDRPSRVGVMVGAPTGNGGGHPNWPGGQGGGNWGGNKAFPRGPGDWKNNWGDGGTGAPEPMAVGPIPSPVPNATVPGVVDSQGGVGSGAPWPPIGRNPMLRKPIMDPRGAFKKGGAVKAKKAKGGVVMKAGAGSGLGRLENAAAQKKKK